MKVLTAVERLISRSCPRPYVFLAGGITNCWEWQDKVIELLSKEELAFTIMNPRRKNFPINDPNASREQITWEFNMLERCDIFTMYFCAGKSDQPICMYELGRNLVRFKENYIHNVAITVEEGYNRKNDVYIQTELVDKNLLFNFGRTIEDHCELIKTLVNGWKEEYED